MAKDSNKKSTKKTARIAEREERRKPAKPAAGDIGSEGVARYADPSDAYATHLGNFISFTSTINGELIAKFKAMITQFDDQFSSEWNSEQVYGRNDPIQTFRNTTRKISIGWDSPSYSYSDAKKNMVAASNLIRMLYPSYESRNSVSTINKAPIIKVSFRNLVQGYDGQALLVTLDGITFSPDLEAGWYDIAEPRDKFIIDHDLVPKLLKFSCTMTVLHQETIGFNSTKWPDNLKSFPNLHRISTEEQGLLDKAAAAAAVNEAIDEAEAATEAAMKESAGDAPEPGSISKAASDRRSGDQPAPQKTEDKIPEAAGACPFGICPGDLTSTSDPQEEENWGSRPEIGQ
jgi:hypothetical protein